MSDNLKEKVNAIGERLKVNGAEMGRKVSAGVSTMSFKVKELFFNEPNEADKLVADATCESLQEPNWDIVLSLCDSVNAEKIQTSHVVSAIKKRVMTKSHKAQYLALVLLDVLVKNCDKAFFEVATERVLDEMVKIVDDPDYYQSNFDGTKVKDKALMMIEDWGMSTTELRYLPVFEQTCKSLKSRGIQFPNRNSESLVRDLTPSYSASAPEVDLILPHLTLNQNPVPSFTSKQTKETFDVARNCIELLSSVLSSSSSPHQDVLKQDLTITLVQQCHQSQSTILRIIETAGDDESLLFEALHVNDEIYKALSKYEELKKSKPEHHMMTPVAVEPDECPHFREQPLIRKPACSGVHGLSHDDMIDDLDEMIFGKKDGETSQWRQDPKKNQQSSKYDILSL